MQQDDSRSGVWFVLMAAILWGTTGTTQAFAPAGFDPMVIGTLRLGDRWRLHDVDRVDDHWRVTAERLASQSNAFCGSIYCPLPGLLFCRCR